ncbi:sensor histidine kinase [Nonomuraea sp. NPDC050556]|uniref:sensor histidine kinase n=1 Tax=Nonomuraea sp. NPDC050556 TaxID=3364369 RepID=UPI00378B2A86
MRPFVRAWRFFSKPQVFDATIVILMMAAAVIGLVGNVLMGNPGDLMLGAWVFLVTAVPLLWRRRYPLLVAAFAGVVDGVSQLTGATEAGNIPSWIAFYSVGRYTSGRRTAIATLVAVVASSAVAQLADGRPGSAVAGGFSPLLLIGMGQFVRLRGELKARSEREATDAAVRAERRRIARELHDVVAHHLTVINALVGGARATMATSQDDARDALRSAEQTSRAALAEMRQLLDVLRADDGDPAADVSTGVGAAGLPALVEQATMAGLPSSLRVTGAAVPLPAAVDHAVYRVAQEALTNSRKHAGGARASVRLAYWPAAVEIEVLDDGIAVGASSTSGFGLGGMAERVALCGGQLQTGPRQEGGFRVHARFPLEQS